MNYTLTFNNKTVELTDEEMDIIFESLDDYRYSDVFPEEVRTIQSKIQEITKE